MLVGVKSSPNTVTNVGYLDGNRLYHTSSPAFPVVSSWILIQVDVLFGEGRLQLLLLVHDIYIRYLYAEFVAHDNVTNKCLGRTNLRNRIQHPILLTSKLHYRRGRC